MSRATGLAPARGWVGAGGPYALLLGFTVLVVLGLGASRLALVLWQWDAVAKFDAVGHILLQGLRSDLMAAGWGLAPALLLLPIYTLAGRQATWTRHATTWLAAVALLLVLMELVTPSFLLEYEVRPNRLFAEYLMYPRDVAVMLWTGYRGQLLAVMAGMVLVGAVLVRVRGPLAAAIQPWPRGRTLVTWPAVALLVLLMIRSNTEGRPVHLGNFAFCDDPKVNSLVANSAYTMLYAVYELKHESGLAVQYGTLPSAEMIERVRTDMGVPEPDFIPGQSPTLHRHSATSRLPRPRNLVLIIAESMGAKFVGRLGGRDVTPNLDRLADSGIWFEQMYATGKRTSRGIEAIVAGFPPTPALSVVRLSKAQKHFYTLGTALRDAGYHNEFIFGGDADFDNLRRFFLSNGFHAVKDQRDFSDPAFRGYLGVSDEDLFGKVLERANTLHGSGKPFFLLALTLSHHPPWDFPAGRIEMAPGEVPDKWNSMKYADYALGRFFDEAMRSPLWQDTVFVVVADHEAEKPGGMVQGFRVPGLILGAGVEPLTVRSTASQIDIAPTTLSLLGIDAATPFIGRDLTRTLPEFGAGANAPLPRALLQYYQDFGLLEGNRLIVLSPDGDDDNNEPDAAQFEFDPGTLELTPLPGVDPEFHRRALAHALMPAWLYNERRYRSDGPAAKETSAKPG